MISQQITGREQDMSGELVITAGPGYLAELIALAIELEPRDNMITNGNIIILPPVVDPPAAE